MNKNREYFNHLADQWDLIIKHDESKIKTILKLTNLKKNSRILDIATGTGILVNYFQEYLPQEILAIDISDKMIKNASKKFSYNNLKFLEQDFYKLNTDKNFDYAICYSAYPHFLNKKAFIKKLYSVLNTGGRFVIAHSEGKELINNRHSKGNVQNLSQPLKSVFQEYQDFKDYFLIDILIDTEELYVLSGIKKADKIG